MRSFIAIEIDENARRRLGAVRGAGILEGGGVRWVRPESLHLTLKFLGEIAPSAVPLVTEAMEEASQDVGPFYLELKGLGFFPDARRPRVFWAGIRDRGGGMARLHARLEEALGRRGFPMDTRPFHPHLTLARIKGRLDRPPRMEGRGDDLFGAQTVHEMVLFKSELRPQGPRYTSLSVVGLKE